LEEGLRPGENMKGSVWLQSINMNVTSGGRQRRNLTRWSCN